MLLASLSPGPGCGSYQPNAPSPPQISGSWVGEQQLTTVSGAECLAATFDDRLKRPSQFHATLTQSGASVTATLDIDHTGSVCTLALACVNGAMRDLLPASETIHATIDNGTITGFAAENDDVVESGKGERVSVLVAESSFRLARQ